VSRDSIVSHLELSRRNSKQYRKTGQGAKDFIYNWMIDLYTKRGKLWQRSDEWVFGGFIYHVMGYFGYVMLFGALWWFVDKTQELKGEFHAIAFLLILLIVRIGMLLSAVRKLDGKKTR
jgi:hypothetical protein